MEFLNSFTITHGYALITKRYKPPKDRGPIHLVYLQCTQNTGVRETSTRYIECPFRLVLRCDKHADCWCFNLTNPVHNHYLAVDSTLASLRHEEIETKET